MMKPCAKNREPIVWLTLGELDARRAEELRTHLETCQGCRGYLAEISKVTERLAAPEVNPEVQASEVFHQKLAGRLRAADVRQARLKWRVALAALAAVVVIDTSVVLWRRPPAVSSPPLAVTQTAPALGTDDDLAPTVANYQRVANESSEKLDALLTRQANRELSSAPVYTDSTLAPAEDSF
jgi:anti-sigma factor RsiW